MTTAENVKTTKEQLEIAELAAPLAKYLRDNNMICGVALVTMNGVSLYWEWLTADYEDNFTKVLPPRSPGLPR